jgi:hypothetical protein
MQNLKRPTWSLVNCEECCTSNLRTKLNTWGCKPQFSKRISSFQSWSGTQNRVNQLRILLCNFTKNASMKNLKQPTCSLVNCDECFINNLRTKSNNWVCKEPFSKCITSFQSWSACQNRVNQLRISFCNFTKNSSMKNLKQPTCSLVDCKECCTINLRMRLNASGCKQPFSKRILSFQSWSACQNRVNQLLISFCNFTENASMKNLKKTLLRSLQYKECLAEALKTKCTRWSRKQQFPTWIWSFRLWLYMIFVTTNFAYPTITPLKITQLQIWNVRCWEHCNRKNVWQ